MATESTTEINNQLKMLIQYEIDGAFLLSQAIENVNSPAIRETLIKFRQECEETIQELAHLIHHYGGEAPAHTKDFKGFFMQGYAAMRGLFSDQGVVKALHTNLSLIVRAFEAALLTDLPEAVKPKVQKAHSTAKAHLDYVKSQI